MLSSTVARPPNWKISGANVRNGLAVSIQRTGVHGGMQHCKQSVFDSLKKRFQAFNAASFALRRK